jgi:hypothetical protein
LGGDESAALDDSIECGAIDHEVFDDGERGRPERLDDDLLA